MTRRLFLLLFLGFLHSPILAAEPLKVTWEGSRDFVALRDMAGTYGCSIQGPTGRRITLVSKWHKIVFSIDSREVLVDGTVVWLHEPLQRAKGRWSLRAVDARKVIDPLMRPGEFVRSTGYRVVVIDPGHGGEDSGAKGKRGLEEKRLALDISRRVRAQLANAGVKVYMTRESDRFIELEERCRKAKSWGADLFVSIHFNSAGSPEANGTETYVLAAAGYQSTSGGSLLGFQLGNRNEGPNSLVGHSIQKALNGSINEGDRGVKRSRFLVLKNAPCPAALVECAFLSNPREEELLLGDGFRESIAKGISKGVLDYLATVKRIRAVQP